MTHDTVPYNAFGEEPGSKESNILAHNNNSIPGTSDTMNLSKQGIIGKTQEKLSELEVTPRKNAKFEVMPWKNDDGPWKGSDNGQTFGMAAQYRDKNWIVGGRMDAYTNHTSYDQELNQLGGTRIDTAEIYA